MMAFDLARSNPPVSRPCAQSEIKCGALLNRRPGPHFAPMPLNDSLHGSQADSVSREFRFCV